VAYSRSCCTDHFAGVSCENLGNSASESPSWPNSASRGILVTRFSLEPEGLVDQVGLNAHAARQKEFQKAP
jgi:hypothetical protein